MAKQPPRKPVVAAAPTANPTARSTLTPPGLAPILSRAPGRTLVVAQLGQSLDGRIATPTGESRWINRDEALNHVHRLRATLDAVVVGVGTVVADDPLLNVRRVQGRNPARVVIDPSGRCPPSARCLSGTDGARRIVIRSEGLDAPAPLPGGVEVLTVPARDGRLDPHDMVAALAAADLPTMLIEGGAWTISEFINARAIDRLHVLVAPMILGSGKTGLSLAPIARLDEALRPNSETHVLADGDVLFDLDLSSIRRPDLARA